MKKTIEFTEEDVSKAELLIKALDGKDVKLRAESENLFSLLNQNNMTLLLRVSEKINATIRKKPLMRLVEFLSKIVGLIGIAVILLVVRFKQKSNAVSKIMNAVQKNIVFCERMYIATINKGTKTQFQLARKVVLYQDIKIVGALAEAFWYKDTELHILVEDALLILLPSLNSSVYEQMSEMQRKSLHSIIQPNNADKNPDLIISLIKSLSRIRHFSSVMYINLLANEHPKTDNQKVVYSIADAYLPVWKAK